MEKRSVEKIVRSEVYRSLTLELSKLKSWNIIGMDLIGDGSKDTKERYSKAISVVQKTNVKLKKYLSKLKVPVNIYFNFSIINSFSPGAGYKASYKDISLTLKDYSLGDSKNYYSSIKDDRSAINVIIASIKNSQFGGSMLPNTPWTTVHRMAHGMLSSFDGETKNYDILDELRSAYETDVYDILEEWIDRKGIPRALEDMGRSETFWGKLGTYGSARRRNVMNWYEAINEMMTQFIVTGGKITVNPIFGKNGEIYLEYEDDLDKAEKQFLEDLKDKFGDYIRASIGKWLIV